MIDYAEAILEELQGGMLPLKSLYIRIEGSSQKELIEALEDLIIDKKVRTVVTSGNSESRYALYDHPETD